MITPFGKQLRKIRNQHGVFMKDMAQLLKVSPSLVSSVETGRKSVPKYWIEIIAQEYNLTAMEVANLKNAALDSAASFRIDVSRASEAQRGAALSFARNFGSISDETAMEIANMLTKKEEG